MQTIEKNQQLPRRSGLLLPIFSLPSKYGIGSFGIEAFHFIDFLKKSGQTYWQILPLGTTGFGNSPYQSFSAYAGNPYFIDFDAFIELGFLSQAEVEEQRWQNVPDLVDYGLLYQHKKKMLKKAYIRFLAMADPALKKEITHFAEEQKVWLFAYACFMLLKEKFADEDWQKWPDQYKYYDEYLLTQFAKENKEDLEYYYFEQFFFFTQWQKIKNYARENDIQIIGDLPIYIALDSADVWSSPDLFYLDENLYPTIVAGCPPDYFSEDGQLWGNPLYNWEKMAEQNYAWWIKRLAFNFDIYDIVRIDHFRGFEAYWSVPYGSETARNGQWNKGPAYHFFDSIFSTLGNVRIIAEDLGFLTDEVYQLRDDYALPGMVVLQFAFEETMSSHYLPHNLNKNSIIYTGTHDNSTMLGWLKNEKPENVALSREYFSGEHSNSEEFSWTFMQQAMQSVSSTCILTVQDLLSLGDEARINTPGTTGYNWEWRLLPGQLNTQISKKLHRLTWISGRLNQV